MSQPCDKFCETKAPGKVDEELNEFWSGNPWLIYQNHNLSCFERNRTYLNVRGKDFIEISHLTGADVDGDTRASLAIDFRNTGQLDLVVRQVGGGPLIIFENRFPARHYLKVSLRGSKTNRLGIGSRIMAEAGGLRLTRELYPANTYVSQSPSLAHFGLGDAKNVDRLTVRWLSGLEQEFRDLPADRHIVLTEGSTHIETVEPGTMIAP